MMRTEPVLFIIMFVFGVDAVFTLGLIALKAIHRKRMRRHQERRTGYVALLSSHLAFPNHTTPIPPHVATDAAFLDALIDIRNAVAGPEVATLRGIIDRSGVIEVQEARLARRFPLGGRLRAAVSLAELGDESSAALLSRYLGDKEPEVRIQCARGLGRMQWTPAIDAIVDRLSYETSWVRSRFADTLIGFGAKATWPLVAYVRVNHHFETAGPVAAIRTLGTIGDATASEPLIETLSEATDPEIRIAIVEALGALGTPLAIEPLKAAARSTDWRLRAKAATALGSLGIPGAIPVLTRGLIDPNWWVRRNSASALTRVPGGIAALFGALRHDDGFARDAAAEALSDSGELAAARTRVDSGEESEADRRLLEHMAGVLA